NILHLEVSERFLEPSRLDDASCVCRKKGRVFFRVDFFAYRAKVAPAPGVERQELNVVDYIRPAQVARDSFHRSGEDLVEAEVEDAPAANFGLLGEIHRAVDSDCRFAGT